LEKTAETYPGDVTIRTMGQADLGDILEIERLSFISPWTRGMFEDYRRYYAILC